MNNQSIALPSGGASVGRILLLSLIVACLLTVSGCGGSDTKVITAQKTLVMRDSIFNITDFQVYQAHFDASLTDGQTISLRDIEKREFNDLLEQNGVIDVRSVFIFDGKEMVYEARRIDSWSDMKKMRRNFQDAEKDVREFLGDPEETQLKLD